MERGIERARVATRPGLEPVALADTVVERGVGIQGGVVGLVERHERRFAVGLLVPGGEQRAVLPVQTVTSSPVDSVIFGNFASAVESAQ